MPANAETHSNAGNGATFLTAQAASCQPPTANRQPPDKVLPSYRMGSVPGPIFMIQFRRSCPLMVECMPSMPDFARFFPFFTPDGQPGSLRNSKATWKSAPALKNGKCARPDFHDSICRNCPLMVECTPSTPDFATFFPFFIPAGKATTISAPHWPESPQPSHPA